MANMALFPDTLRWKINLRDSYEKKNNELQAFTSILRAQEGLRKKIQTLTKYNGSLESQVSQLKKRGTGSPTTEGNEESSIRIQKLQEELTASYKRNSEDATAMLSLTNQIQKIQREMLKKDEKMEQQQLEMERIQHMYTMKSNEAKASEEKFQTIKKELDAVQQAFKHVESQKKALDKDYQELLNRWIIKAEEDAKTMNLANEIYSDMVSMKRQDQMARQGQIEASNIDLASCRPTIPINSVPTTSKKTFAGHKGEANCCAYSSTGNLLATGSSDRNVSIWEGSVLSKKGSLTGAGQSIMCTNFSLGDEYVLGASNDNTIRIWKIDTQRIRCTLTSHIGKVYTAEFTSDGERVISGSHDRTLKVWDLTRGGKCLRTIFCTSSCNDLCLPLEGTMICSVHLDSNIRLWDARSSDRPTDVLESIHTKQVTSVCLSPDGKTVLTCSRDNTLKLIDLKMNQTLQTFFHPTFRTETNWTRACLSPDGTMAAAGSSGGSVFIWDALTGTLKTTLEGQHNRAINSVAWSTQGELCSCDRSGVVSIWK